MSKRGRERKGSVFVCVLKQVAQETSDDANGEMYETEEPLCYNFSECVKIIHSIQSLYNIQCSI